MFLSYKARQWQLIEVRPNINIIFCAEKDTTKFEFRIREPQMSLTSFKTFTVTTDTELDQFISAVICDFYPGYLQLLDQPLSGAFTQNFFHHKSYIPEYYKHLF